MTELSPTAQAELFVTGRDRFNNYQSECTPEFFADTFIQVGLGSAHGR